MFLLNVKISIEIKTNLDSCKCLFSSLPITRVNFCLSISFLFLLSIFCFLYQEKKNLTFKFRKDLFFPFHYYSMVLFFYVFNREMLDCQKLRIISFISPFYQMSLYKAFLSLSILQAFVFSLQLLT